MGGELFHSSRCLSVVAGQAESDADAELHHATIVEPAEGVGGAEHTIERSLRPRAEEGGQVCLAPLDWAV